MLPLFSIMTLWFGTCLRETKNLNVRLGEACSLLRCSVVTLTARNKAFFLPFLNFSIHFF